MNVGLFAGLVCVWLGGFTFGRALYRRPAPPRTYVEVLVNDLPIVSGSLEQLRSVQQFTTSRRVEISGRGSLGFAPSTRIDLRIVDR